MKNKNSLLKLLIPAAMMLAVTSCSGTITPDPVKNDTGNVVTEKNITEDNSERTEEKTEDSSVDINTSPLENSSDNISDTSLKAKDSPFEDNTWAVFLVSPSLSAYDTKEQGDEILGVLSRDSVIGEVASLSAAADPPPVINTYGTDVITAGGPVDTSLLAYGRLSEIPDSFLNAMVDDMRTELGEGYGGHNSGSGMGYRTFYQASYDASTGWLQANQVNGYWARTLGAFSEHCAGVAVDFDISYQNSEFLEYTGSQNREGGASANAEFSWLADNAHKYGFIWRYKIDGADESAGGNRTGTIREGWHWRFTGVYHATRFWEKCAADTDDDGIADKGYMTNDNYIWEDYYYENISGNSDYPQSEYEAFTMFYDSEKGNRCSWDEYSEIINK